jgi:RNA polymerase sigma-70 factor (ECF subfamily)
MGLGRRELERAFRQHRDSLYRFLYRLTRNASDAEDLLQESFLAVWRKREQCREASTLAGYLRTTAYRTFLNHQEKLRRREALAPRPAPAALAAPAAVAAARGETMQILRDRLDEALDALPAEQQQAFLLFRFEGLTAAEIAAALEVPTKTIETRVRRATLRLAEILQPHEEHLTTG